jgi:ADP-heptose:LPS heptosyltransferase
MRLLIVKTSSMGDVVHAMPVVADILRHHPQRRSTGWWSLPLPPSRRCTPR